MSRSRCPRCRLGISLRGMPRGVRAICPHCGAVLVLGPRYTRRPESPAGWWRHRTVSGAALAASVLALAGVAGAWALLPPSEEPAPLAAGLDLPAFASAQEAYLYALQAERQGRSDLLDRGLEAAIDLDYRHEPTRRRLASLVDERLATLDNGDAGQLLGLALWCSRFSGVLRQEQDRILQAVLRVDPDNARARTLLGYIEEDETAEAPQPWSRQASDAAEGLRKDLKRELGIEMASLEWEPYVVLLERLPDDPRPLDEIMASYADRLHEAYTGFRSMFGEERFPPIQKAMTVLVLSSRESYDAYCRRFQGAQLSSHIGGTYEYVTRRLVIFQGSKTPYEVTIHEGVHQIAHHYTEPGARSDSFWFQEGLATYFEAYRRVAAGTEDGARDRVEFGQLNPQRLPMLQTAIEEKDRDLLPLHHLLRITPTSFWRMMSSDLTDARKALRARMYYAEAWSLVYFLRHGADGRYRAAFDDYLADELAGRGGFERFQDRFGPVDRVEGEWLEHVRTLGR